MGCEAIDSNGICNRIDLYVVVLHYGDVADTLECIRSIMHTTGVSYVVCVVDNQGDMPSVEEYGSIVRILRPNENLGYSAGNNYAIDNSDCSYEYVAFVNNDAVVMPETFRELVAVMRRRPGCGALSPVIRSYYNEYKLEFYGGSIDGMHGTFAKHRASVAPAGEVLLCTYLIGCILCVRRELFGEIGSWDERYFYMYEDVELSYRIQMHGYVCACVADAVAFHKTSRSMKSNPLSYEYYNMRNKLIWRREFLSRCNRTNDIRLISTSWRHLRNRITIRSAKWSLAKVINDVALAIVLCLAVLSYAFRAYGMAPSIVGHVEKARLWLLRGVDSRRR